MFFISFSILKQLNAFFVFVLLAGVCPQHWHQVNVSVWQSEGDAMVGRITKAFFQMTAAGFAGMFC